MDDSILYTFVGARGTFSLSLDSGGIPRFSFTFRCMFVSRTDASLGTPVYDATRPPVWKNGAFTINRAAGAAQNLNFACNNVLTNPDNPNSLEGFDPALITGRKIEGSINPLETLVATRDIMGDFRAGTTRPLHARMGSTAGNRIGITLPSVLYKGADPGDRSGLLTAEVPFEAIGQDSGAFITFW
jgi:hypothetical protein